MDKVPTESWVIDYIREALGELAGRRVLAGGRVSLSMADLDDCAIIEVDGPQSLVVGSDYIRGREFDLFRRGLLGYYDLGYYLIGANLSDIAAMGAAPLGATVILRYPADLQRDDVARVIDGIAAACAEHGPCPVLGGDTGGATDLVLGAAVIGQVPGRPLMRSNAARGDRVFLLGAAGLAIAAQLVLGTPLEKDLTAGERNRLLRSWRRPRPFLAEGDRLSRTGLRIACQDTSDGVKTTLQQIAEASSVGILVKEEAVPIDPLIARVADLVGRDALEVALSASVDFGLVFTLPASTDALEIFAGYTSSPLHEIGKVVEGGGEAFLERADGSREDPLPGSEYQQ